MQRNKELHQGIYIEEKTAINLKMDEIRVSDANQYLPVSYTEDE